MDLKVKPIIFNNTQSFTGIKLTKKYRIAASKLIQEYIDFPSLQTRDELFTIMDPYIQRQAKKIASDKYYYDDILQNIRINLFKLLDEERAKEIKLGRKPKVHDDSIISQRWKKLKAKLFSEMDHKKGTQIPQKDSNIIPWHTLSQQQQEQLIPAKIFEDQNLVEDLNDVFKKVQLSTKEKLVLNCFFEEGMSLDEIAFKLGLTHERIRQIKEKAIKNIRTQLHVE